MFCARKKVHVIIISIKHNEKSILLSQSHVRFYLIFGFSKGLSQVQVSHTHTECQIILNRSLKIFSWY